MASQPELEMDLHRGKMWVSKLPRLERNIKVIRQLLRGSSIAEAGRAAALTDSDVRAVIESMTVALVEEITRYGVAHPFTREKYPHAYCEHRQGDYRLVPRWLRLGDLKAESAFVLQRLRAIQALVRVYRNEEDKSLKET